MEGRFLTKRAVGAEGIELGGSVAVRGEPEAAVAPEEAVNLHYPLRKQLLPSVDRVNSEAVRADGGGKEFVANPRRLHQLKRIGRRYRLPDIA